MSRRWSFLPCARREAPDGQNVNKVSSAVHLRYYASSLPEPVKERLLALPCTHHPRGVVVIKAQQFRGENKTVPMLARLNALVQSVAVAPRTRRATKPAYGSQQRRLAGKTTG